MGTLYLHIGSHKTATSSIQKFLSDCSKEFNIYYPMAGRINGSMHHALVYDLLSEIGDDVTGLFFGPNVQGEVWRDFAHEIESISDQDVVVSSEEFFGIYARVGRRAIEELRKKLSMFDTIKIVVYLRRQDSFCESSYNQNIKFSKWTGDFVDQMRNLDTIRFDYFEILSQWANVFGAENIIVKAFDQDALLEKDIIKDFMKILGVDLHVDTGEYKINEKIPDELLELKRCINYTPYPFPEYRDGVNDFILRLKTIRYNKGLLHMPREYYEEMAPVWKEVNLKISKKFLAGAGLFVNDFLPSEQVDFLEDYNSAYMENLISICESAMCNEKISSANEKDLHSYVIKGCLVLCSIHGIQPKMSFDVISNVLIEADRKANRDIAFFKNQMMKYKKIVDGDI